MSTTIPDPLALVAELRSQVARAQGQNVILRVRIDELERAHWQILGQQRKLADAMCQMERAAGLAPEHRRAVGESAPPRRSPRPDHLSVVR